ncbi:L,D-transpeptidase catalytic domain [Nocardioides alpinus]|uniref:L,D-transpeptidase catalytic domain n=1 Tax=Nocardioides alpinus TaxID=748909 RepID=A0A1I1B2S6_9ACTN|nr:L,D-transpeptidase [Nocardioides alpinus]SFB44669.1 L,D-transpeptidase catalytic domain [Nocardioides alpinus]
MPNIHSTSTADSRLSVTSRLRSGVVVIALAALLATALTSCGADEKDKRSRSAPVDLATLVASTTHAKLPRAPKDAHPLEATDGDVVHPRRVLAVYAAPGRRPFAKVTPQQMNDTWLPVIDQRRGWTQVLLPSRPNGSTGWLRTAQLEQRQTPYLVRVHLGSRQLELVRDGDVIGTWSVAVGAPETPTPTGRTFLLGSVVDTNQGYSPLILPLGSHSDTLDSYGGGPGTVALHGWPDASVFGQAISHGCVRVPADALEQLRLVPLGSLVIVDQN